MLGLGTNPVQPPAPWILARGPALVRAARRGLGIARLKPRLAALRPRSRSGLAYRAHERLNSIRYLTIYHDLTGRFPEGWDAQWCSYEAAQALIWEVDQNWFPVNFDEINEYWYSGGEEDEELPWWISYERYGVPWEVCGILDVNEPCRPLVAIYALSGGVPACDWDMGNDDTEPMVDWWDMLPTEVVRGAGPEFTWPQSEEGIALMRSRLAELDPPLNGLATLLDCTYKQTGNPILDRPEYWAGEYDYEDDFCWCADDIDRLAGFWSACRDGVEAMKAYIEWFQLGNSAAHVIEVVRTLARLGRKVDRALATRRARGVIQPRTLMEILFEEEEE
jgi:hypothetical protein